MTDAAKQDAQPEKPKGVAVRVVRKTRGYPLGVVELSKSAAETLVKAGVARYLK